MAEIKFKVNHSFAVAPRVLWDELVDWKGHEAWVPMTRVEVEPGDPTAVDTEFTAWTGLGPVSLKDRMRVARCDWNTANNSGRCEVEKLGPVLRGAAGFTIEPGPSSDTSELVWFENVSINRLPGFVAPVLATVGATGFRQALRSLEKLLTSRQAA